VSGKRGGAAASAQEAPGQSAGSLGVTAATRPGAALDEAEGAERPSAAEDGRSVAGGAPPHPAASGVAVAHPTTRHAARRESRSRMAQSIRTSFNFTVTVLSSRFSLTAAWSPGFRPSRALYKSS